MQATLSNGRIGLATRVLFRCRSRDVYIRSIQTRASTKTRGSYAELGTARLGASPVHNEQGLFASLRQLRHKKVDENWIHGPETIVFHVPKPHIFHRITAFFPAFAIFVTLTSIDTIWNHGLIENPNYNRFHPTADQPQYTPKPLGERLIFASFAAGSCMLIVGFVTTVRRRVVRTIAFRTDQPRKTVTGNNAAARALRMGAGRRMVSLTAASGARVDYPIDELELGRSNRPDTLTIKSPKSWLLPFFFEVEDAQIGWPGVTTMLEPFPLVSGNLKFDKKTLEQRRTVHNRHAKQLFGLLWQTHAGVDLAKINISDPWTSQ